MITKIPLQKPTPSDSSAPRLRRFGRNDKEKIIGIIGSEGKMGKAFTKLFSSSGLKVIGSDLASPISNEDVISQADITLFSVPITETPNLIRKLAPRAKKNALLTDLTSIKSPALKAFQDSAPPHCEIMGLHPMFGPDGVADLKKQIIALCPVKKGPLSEWLISFLQKNGAIFREVTPEHHDRLMSFIQGTIHLSSIALGMAFHKLDLNLEETIAFSSPIYRLRLDMVGRILYQDPRLYGEIALKNSLTKKTLQAYIKSLQQLLKNVEENDLKGFEKSFMKASKCFGPFSEEAYHRTTELIERSKDL